MLSVVKDFKLLNLANTHLQHTRLVFAFCLGCMLVAMCSVKHRMNTLLSFRFFGAHRTSGKSDKWGFSTRIKGQFYNIGNHSTEELAAQAYDKVRIYQASTQLHIVWLSLNNSKTSCVYRVWVLQTSQKQVTMLSPSTCKSQLGVWLRASRQRH